MKPLATSLLLLLLVTAHAGPGWENKVIGDVHFEVPSDCQTGAQNTPVRSRFPMTKTSSLRAPCALGGGSSLPSR
jgi:hypothetical protein